MLSIAEIEVLLKKEMSATAEEALTQARPGDFHYGRAVGMYAGLSKAMALIAEEHTRKEREKNNH